MCSVFGSRVVRSHLSSSVLFSVRFSVLFTVLFTVLFPIVFSVVSATAQAQAGPPVRDLPKPTKEIEEPYSLVTAAREGGRGRVVVADGTEGEVSAVDFETGERTALGRQGAGPGEYRLPGGLYRIRGDTLWVMDPAQQRFTVFLPDHKPGVPFLLSMFDQATRTSLMAPFHVDEKGLLYSSLLVIGAGGAAGLQIPDSVDIARMDPRATSAQRTVLAKLRFPTSGTPEMRMEGQTMHYKMAYPGLVTADSWAVFPDGRVAIVHGRDYSVEFIRPDGSRTTSRPIPYPLIPVTAADRVAEMAEAKRQLAEQTKAAQRAMPAGFSLDIQMTAPESWPANYPAISPMMIHASPDGMLWVRRSVPARIDREQWDVISPAGVVVARWRVPARTRLVGVGDGVVFTVRLDEDDLQYLGRVSVR